MEGVLRDVLAGVTLALTSVPQAVAYAEVSGVAGWRGLACMGLPCAVYALVTTSPWTSIGVTSITALMSRSALAEAHASLREAEYVDVLGAWAVAVGAASAVLALAQVGGLSSRIPRSVNAGFKLGFGVAVMCSQVAPAIVKQPAALAAKVEADWTIAVPAFLSGARSFLRLAYALTHPWHWDPQPLALAALVTAGVLGFKQLLPERLARALPPGVEVLLFVAVASALSIRLDYDGAVVGAPGGGGGSFQLTRGVWDPATWRTLVDTCFGGSILALARSALTFAAVDFLQVFSVCSAFEAENQLGWSPTRELGAQALACVASGAVAGGPVGVSLSRSLVSRISGAQTPRASFVHGLAAILLLPYAHYLKSTPKAALSAVVLAAIAPGVVRPKTLLALGAADAAVGWATAAVSILTDPTTGFVSGLALAALLALMRTHKKAPVLTKKDA